MIEENPEQAIREAWAIEREIWSKIIQVIDRWLEASTWVDVREQTPKQPGLYFVALDFGRKTLHLETANYTADGDWDERYKSDRFNDCIRFWMKPPELPTEWKGATK